MDFDKFYLERELDFLVNMNLKIDMHYARLLSMNTDALNVWHHSWTNELTFVEDDRVW